MKIVERTHLSAAEKTDVRQLWNNEYPVQLAHATRADLKYYLSGLTHPVHFLLIEADTILGWACVFERESEKWFAIILDSQVHGKGFGQQLLQHLQQHQQKLCGWVIDHDRDVKTDGTDYQSPLGFYLKNGFRCRPEIRLETEKISAVKIEWPASVNQSDQ